MNARPERASRLFGRIADLIWQHPRRWFIATLLISGFLLAGLPRIRFIFDFARFYSEGHPVAMFYRTYQEGFAGNPQILAVLPVTDHHAFHPETLRELKTLTDTLRSLHGVSEIMSTRDIRLPVRDVFGYRAERVVRSGVISAEDSLKLTALPFLRNQLFSKDGRFPAILIRFEDDLTDDSTYAIIERIDLILSEHLDDYHITGRYWGEIRYNEMLRTETLKGIAGAVIVLVLMLWLLFRRIGSVLLPAVAILTGVMAFFGLKGWAGWPIDILGVLFPPLLLIVGLSDMVHLYAKVQWKLKLGHDLRTAVREAWSETGYATFLTSLTTGIGFISLLTTDISPIRNFGVEAGWGVLMMFGVCIVVIPMFLRLSRRKALLPRAASNRQWNDLAEKGYRFSSRRWHVPGFVLALILICAWGVSQIESGVRNYWQIAPDTRLSKDLNFYEENFGGIRYLDIVIGHRDSSVAGDANDIRLAHQLTVFLRNHPAIGSVISVSDVPSTLEMARYAGLPEHFEPAASDVLLESDLDRWYSEDSAGYHQMISLDHRWMRISARLANVRTDSALAIQDEIATFFESTSDDHTLIFTGNSVLMDTTNDMLVGNMFQSLGLAFLIIALLMGLLFRSVRMLLISLIPNLLPLLVALGMIGILQIPLGTSTALILTIGFVIAVDDTIHYLMKFRLQLRETGDLRISIKNTTAQVGRAMVLSSAVMLAAFVPLLFSDFLEQFYFAVVVSGVIVSALVSDLLLLPWLLLRFFSVRHSDPK